MVRECQQQNPQAGSDCAVKDYLLTGYNGAGNTQRATRVQCAIHYEFAKREYVPD